MARTKTKVNQTLDTFLFNKIAHDPAYQQWAQSYRIPDYITDNLHPSKQLRDYQEVALKHFIWLYEHDRSAAGHVLFNMATGTGKTLVMAAVVLYLYEKGYRNFMFLVYRDNIIKQAVRNFSDYKFEKYLFNPKGVRINGQNVDVRAVNNLTDGGRSTINFMFFSTQLLYSRLHEDKENGLTLDDFVNNDIVILADEAHSLNVETRKKTKSEAAEQNNWERAVLSAASARPSNLLIEFTATIDLANQAIHQKYEDKIVHRYDFLAFNKDGYSKDVKFLYNQEVHSEDQKRLLIINAVALSEYRRLLAERVMNVSITPIVLIKSVRIAQSEADRNFFDSVINSLRPGDLDRLKELSRENKDHEHEILADMFRWLASSEAGLVTGGDWDGLRAFVAQIRSSFAPNNTLIYNSQKKEKAELLTLLDTPRNTIRAIFSVSALNEGWDVLGLYDIIHFDISEVKKVSLQDIQLIGRGARYNPYELPASYRRDEDSPLASIFGSRGLEFNKYKRKFDNDPYDRGRVLETFVYHFVKTGMFLENLQRDLLGEGIVADSVEKKTIKLKQAFLESQTYQKGFVLVNKPVKRTKTLGTEIDTTFKSVIKVGAYNLQARGLSDFEQNQIVAGQKVHTIAITEEYFSLPVIRKALVAAEANFFRINNLREHIIGIRSVDELIKTYLPLYQIKYAYEEGKSIYELGPGEKLQLLVGKILPEVRRAIDINMPRITGSNQFRPVSLASVFAKEKNIYLTSFPVEDSFTSEKSYASNDERAKAQTDNEKPELQYDIHTADWYAYSENYGTSEEKKFVKYVASQITSLRAMYPGAEVYLIRNELDYWLYSPKDGRRFSPDYMLVINDTANNEMYYQCLIEPKGGHLLAHDAWKEEALVSIAATASVVLNAADSVSGDDRAFLSNVAEQGYKLVRPLGLPFYNSDTRGEDKFALAFQAMLLGETAEFPKEQST